MTGILCSLPMIGAPTADPPADPLTVTLSASTVSKTGSTDSITTANRTATASGGTSPYTYSWARRSGDSSITATKSGQATTAFTRNNCVAGTSYQAVWRCTATDADGNTDQSSNLTVTITRESDSSGGTFLGIDNTIASNIGIASTKTATYTINSDGTITATNATVSDWNSESTVGSSYEVKATVTSGSLTTGTTGSWLALSSNRSWSVTDSTQNDVAQQATMTLQIRLVGETTVLDSATITFDANALTGA